MGNSGKMWVKWSNRHRAHPLLANLILQSKCHGSTLTCLVCPEYSLMTWRGLIILQNRTEENFIQLKLRPCTGGVRAHNTNRQIAKKTIFTRNTQQKLFTRTTYKVSGSLLFALRQYCFYIHIALKCFCCSLRLVVCKINYLVICLPLKRDLNIHGHCEGCYADEINNLIPFCVHVGIFKTKFLI